MRAHLFTFVLSVLTAVVIGAAWLHFHPPLRMVRVDMGSLFDQQKQRLAGRIKPGMSDQEQKVLFQSAADYADRLDSALAMLARECNCAVVNSAALLQVPPGNASGIADTTGRVRELLGSDAANGEYSAGEGK